MVTEPPIEMSEPGKPEFVSTIDAGASVTRVSVFEESLWLTNVTLGALICTGCCLEPWMLYWATAVPPVQEIIAVEELHTPACDSDTVALLHTPGSSVTLPRSRSASLVRSSG